MNTFIIVVWLTALSAAILRSIALTELERKDRIEKLNKLTDQVVTWKKRLEEEKENLSYVAPCIEGDCAKTCQHGASRKEFNCCNNKDCRHYLSYLDTSSNCAKVHFDKLDPFDCNGFVHLDIKNVNCEIYKSIIKD